MKDYVVCREKCNGAYTVRVKSDCSTTRFDVIDSFESYEEASEFIYKSLLQRKESVCLPILSKSS
jgi:hypothetical protein